MMWHPKLEGENKRNRPGKKVTGRLPPLQTDISCFCEMKYLLENKTFNKNEENTLKEQNEILLTVYGFV
jgi:hypothetical protein